jgi:hypothetical protein
VQNAKCITYIVYIKLYYLLLSILGDGLVIHMTGDSNESLNASVSNSGCIFTICGQTFAKAYVQIDDFWKVADGSKVYKNNNKDREQWYVLHCCLSVQYTMPLYSIIFYTFC